MVLDNLGNIKEKLEAKLSEIGSLVQELGKSPTNGENRRSPKRKSISRSSPRRSPDQKVWKNVLTLAEVAGNADGRLPPIVEGKYYPRKTLEYERDRQDPQGMITDFGFRFDELLEMLPDAVDAIDSPDLGPPPIAHFENGDPTKIEQRGDDVQSENNHNADDDMRPAMFANLETRKRRRETTNLREIISRETDLHNLQQRTNTGQSSSMGKSLKSGAKRKLDATVDEDRGAGNVLEGDGFALDKTPIEPGVNNISRSGPPKSENPGSPKLFREPGVECVLASVQESSLAIGKHRKALGPSMSHACSCREKNRAPLTCLIQRAPIPIRHLLPRSRGLPTITNWATQRKGRLKRFSMANDSKKSRKTLWLACLRALMCQVLTGKARNR